MEKDGYQFDMAGIAGEPSEEEGLEGHFLGLHFNNLFDEDTDQSGELMDYADGQFYDNSTYTGAEDLVVEVQPDTTSFDEILKDMADEYGFPSVEAFLDYDGK